MILAFHCIFSTYGFWLPNEPRGSWSTYVAAWELYRFGPATKVNVRRSIARNKYNRGNKIMMQSAMQDPPVRLNEKQIQTVGSVLPNLPYDFHALAVMPDHVHAVIGRTSRNIDRVVGHVKSEMTRALRSGGWFTEQRPWADHRWNIYLDSPQDVARAVDYVEQNPIRADMPPQHWPDTRPFSRAACDASI